MHLRVTIYVLIGFFSATSYGWTAQDLVGKAISHPGADCHNATLVAKGYEDVLIAVSDVHMKFYLQNFCSQSSAPLAGGDIVAVYDSDGRLQHSALALDKDKIFEKESGDGLLYAPSAMNPYYQIKPLTESRYMKNRVAMNYSFSNYRCADAKSVRQRLRSCEVIAEKLGVGLVRREFEKMMLTTSSEFNLSEEALQKTKGFAEALAKMHPDEPCTKYLQVMADSIETALAVLQPIGGMPGDPGFLAFSKHSEWVEVAKELNSAIFSAGQPIAVVVDQDIPWGSPDKLLGRLPIGPGANSLNATLVANGYEDFVGADGEALLKFYINKFCTPSSYGLDKGDIGVFKDGRGKITQSFLALGSGKIFEKENGSGLLFKIGGLSPKFRVREISEVQNLSYSTFRCPDASLVRPQTKSCRTRAKGLGVNDIRSEFDAVVFDPIFKLSLEALAKANGFAAQLAVLPATDPCAEYLRAVADSLATSVDILADYPPFTELPQSQEWIRVSGVLRTR